MIFVLGQRTKLAHKPIYGKIKYEPRHEISNNVVCATSKGSDQPGHTHSLMMMMMMSWSLTTHQPFWVISVIKVR